MLKDEQKSAKTLPQRLAGLNKGRGAWGESVALPCVDCHACFARSQ